MNKQIQIITTQQTTKPTKSGSYTMLEVTYKDLSNGGKTDGKKIMSFASKEVFAVLSKAVQGETYNITTQKNENSGYLDWVAATKDTGGSQVMATDTKAYTSPKSTYETPEERAKRQVYIIRQSSLTNAISVLKTEKNTPTPADVFALAQEMVDWVMENDVKSPASFDDMMDDIPL